MTVTVESIWKELQQKPAPRATYRIQFSPDFTFQDAERLIPYLHSLGISELYASPIFKPRTGSQHGYDVVDYNAINPALGTEETFRQLCTRLQEHGMSLLMDIVPNHMGVSTDNTWWTDVLKHGPSSAYARYFDIDWKPRNRILDNKILLPILHNHYGEVLEEGRLSVVYWHGDFYVHYFENQFPMTPESYLHILDRVLISLPETLEDSEAWIRVETASVRRSLEFLPDYWLTDPESITIRRREQKIIRWRILGLFDKSEVFRTTLEASLETINGTVGNASSFDVLDTILSEQPYHLAFWQVASDEINYRRFFDINDMAAVRTEDLHVFEDTHRLTFKLLAEGLVKGLRIDHPDGLWDPERYFWRLQSGYLDAVACQKLPDSPEEAAVLAQGLQATLESTRVHPDWPLYVLGEKILSDSEALPDTWAIQGTTGYDFMYTVNNLYVDSSSEQAFDQIYSAFTGEHIDFEELTDYTKKLIMNQSLTSEIMALTAVLARIVEQNRRFRGFTQNSLALVMSEFMASLDIYRTYITGPDEVSERDRTYIVAAMDRAKKHNPLVPERVFDFLRDILLMKNFHLFAERHQNALKDFVMKFQQITGPVMAKSVEDTAFYIYNRLVSLNEVGGHPYQFGISVNAFHAHNKAILETYPYTMLSSSTHDTKRSEDIRSRLNVLSEMPDEWHHVINTWSILNAEAGTRVNSQLAPTRNDEYLLYQTLVGTYEPGIDEDRFKQRITRYMHKAINEAKTNSNWINPNQNYASAISSFVDTIWADQAFRESFEPFQQKVAYFGRLNALSQLLLKLTCPGVPDIYQGTELWNFSLVDPDNRRPVDFEQRIQILKDLTDEEALAPQKLAAQLLSDTDPGASKLFLLNEVLNFRLQDPEVFSAGAYVPLRIEGAYAEHVCAFARISGATTIVVVAPRFFYTLTGGTIELPLGPSHWKDTRLLLAELDIPVRDFRNVLTREHISVAGSGAQASLLLGDILSGFPVAFLEKTSD